MGKKSGMISWRIDPELKSALELAARDAGVSVSRLLDRVVGEWLERANGESDPAALQRRLQRAAARSIGAVRGGDPGRAERARATIRRRLAGRRAG